MVLPFRRLALLSPLPPDRAVDALRAALQPARGWQDAMMSRGGGGFAGQAEAGRFTFRRQINYRNSFLPTVTGTIEPDVAGSRIAVTMRMNPLVMVFMLVWLAGVGAGLAAFWRSAQGHGVPQDAFPAIAIPAGMLLFGLALPHFGFWPEAKKAQAFLCETLKAELPPDPDRAL